MANVLKFLRTYSIVILFPTFTALSIYADWTHTQKWKRGLEKTREKELQ